MFFVVVSKMLAPEDEKDNWGARKAMQTFESRRTIVARRLAEAPYMAGDAFTAADISITYALQFARRAGGVPLTEAEEAYVARTTDRDGYRRAMDTCEATKEWAAALGE